MKGNPLMKRKPLAHIPSMIKTVLQETAEHVRGVEFDTVVSTASWAFCAQGQAARQDIVADFWFRGHSLFESPEVRRRPNSFKEKFHALGAYCYAAFRRCLVQ
jgi:hypothetical protein